MYCDNSYRRLFRDFVETSFANDYQVAQFFSAQMSDIAKELYIGRFMMDDGTILYSSVDGYAETSRIDCIFRNGNGVKSKVCVWSEKEHTWSDEEKADVTLLAETIFLFSNHIKLTDMIRRAETTDTLTGVPNDSGIHIHAAKLAAQGKISEVSCFFINLKNFKFINKKVTPRGGDKVLKQFGEKIVSVACMEYEFVARLGGDNFLMLIQNDRVEEVIRKISKMQIYIVIEDRKVDVTVEPRAGYVRISEEDGFSDAINNSSIALNYARKSGQNFVAFEPYMLEMTLRDKKVSSCFGDAIANKEFVVYYQPKVDIKTNEICGSEALVRWVKDGSVVPPMEFIPVLEREGTVCLLDFYMLDAVCEHLKQWIDDGIEPVRVSVNFSKNHLLNIQLVDQIVNVIKRYDVPPQYIEIELTEMSDYKDYKVMESLVNKIKNEGIATSIDDFGTGYSSMTLLRDLNVDTVKLDRSFVVNLEKEQQKDRIMIESVVQMVKALGMEVLAEGVETEEQLLYLKSVGCDVIQGYYFDKPMPERDFVKRLKYHRRYEELELGLENCKNT